MLALRLGARSHFSGNFIAITIKICLIFMSGRYIDLTVFVCDINILKYMEISGCKNDRYIS